MEEEKEAERLAVLAGQPFRQADQTETEERRARQGTQRVVAMLTLLQLQRSISKSVGGFSHHACSHVTGCSTKSHDLWAQCASRDLAKKKPAECIIHHH
jgi:hypothetical protein